LNPFLIRIFETPRAILHADTAGKRPGFSWNLPKRLIFDSNHTTGGAKGTGQMRG
jgi:hypothetical protein